MLVLFGISRKHRFNIFAFFSVVIVFGYFYCLAAQEHNCHKVGERHKSVKRIVKRPNKVTVNSSRCNYKSYVYYFKYCNCSLFAFIAKPPETKFRCFFAVISLCKNCCESNKRHRKLSCHMLCRNTVYHFLQHHKLNFKRNGRFKKPDVFYCNFVFCKHCA